MKDKEILEFCIELADKRAIKEKYMVEYIMSSSVMSKERALDEFNHANMKCCDAVRLYKVNSAEDVELIEEKF